MASNLTNQVRSISEVTTAVAYGDLSKEIDVDVRGEMLDLKITINEMVTRLGNFSREVTRVALEVGTEGKLGGQAEVEGVQGTWKDLTDNVNVRRVPSVLFVIWGLAGEAGRRDVGVACPPSASPPLPLPRPFSLLLR
jgi:hypothetical protein